MEAHLCFDLNEDLLIKLQFLRDVFVSNCCPRKLVDRTINNSWQIELKKQIDTSLYDDNAQNTEEPEQNPGYFDTLNVAYFLSGFHKISDMLALVLHFEKGGLHIICSVNLSHHALKTWGKMLCIASDANPAPSFINLKEKNSNCFLPTESAQIFSEKPILYQRHCPACCKD